jgi:hypothetical protein
MDQRYARDVMAKQLHSTLYWAVATALATFLVWKFADPWMVKNFGTGAPWWVYALLCIRLVGGIAQIVANDAALRKVAAQEEWPVPADEAALGPDAGRPAAGSEFLPN